MAHMAVSKIWGSFKRRQASFNKRADPHEKNMA